MSKQNEKHNPDSFIQQSLHKGESSPNGAVAGKKEFVEPEISTPVDVLEATTFFQATSSGATN
ncbi:MAG: hypothetical protein LC754_04125 [Acidobacteria bacterium]|nr:hypothetical protein [Acidobacteriota bacterium]